MQRWDWKLFFGWLLATTSGWLAGWALGGTLVRHVAEPLSIAVRGTLFAVLFGALAAALAGLGVGVAQWVVLRRYMPRAWRWVVATVGGWTVGGAAALLILWTLSVAVSNAALRLAITVAPADTAARFADTLGGLVGWAVVGAIPGLAQWFIFRRHLPRAYWWIAASSAGIALALVVAYTVVSAPLVAALATARGVVWATLGGGVGAAMGAVAGALYGAITAAALVWLARPVRR
jgi:hypothetical protein